jgi:hypothetical protein
MKYSAPYYCEKKSLKIPKGLSESVNRRRTDYTMAKRNRTKEQTTIYKTLHIYKTKDRPTMAMHIQNERLK